MKKFTSVILVITLIFCLSSTAFSAAAEETGTTYYIDSTDGNDENDGLSADSPKKNFGSFDREFMPGDKILFRTGGIYNEQITPTGSGTKENPITISYYGDISNGRPIIACESDLLPAISMIDISGWVVSGLEFTSDHCGGICIATIQMPCENFEIKDCVFHDICNRKDSSLSKFYSPILINQMGTGATISNVTVSGCSFSSCAYGIQSTGASVEFTPDTFVSPEVSYGKNWVFENNTFENIGFDGLILQSVMGCTVRNCSFTNTCMHNVSYTAPVWLHHCDSVTVENCEISGTANTLDGMTVDFDGWTTNSTYQYIYSHDNTRFIKNCCFDRDTKNSGNTVRYCLSVNDNKAVNWAAFLIPNSADYLNSTLYMDRFSMYNNTFVNCSCFIFNNIKNSVIANNIFSGKLFSAAIQSPFNFSNTITNNCFEKFIPLVYAKNSLFCDPGFSGDDITDPDSFRLSENSGLIGKGTTVCDDMGNRDFYGNELTGGHNIGCYEGAGI